ncbi:hypothetical protein [Catenulispora yoronensis]
MSTPADTAVSTATNIAAADTATNIAAADTAADTTPNPLTATARVLRRHLVTAMGISVRMGVEQ